MVSSSRLVILATAAFAVSVAVSPAEAQFGRAIPRAQADAQSRAAQAQFDNGVRDGIRAGQYDARRGDRFGFTDEREWQRGNAAFRQGFEAGYRRGYVGDGGYGGYGGRGDGGYSGRGNGGYGRDGGAIYANPAMAAGYNDGYEQGLEDARDGDRFDPIGAKDYRKGDHGYDKRFGTRDQWKVAYRDGFRSGYERGYREAQFYRR